MQVIPVDHTDPVAFAAALRRALDGGPALALGSRGEHPREAPEGTAVVLTTSGSSGIPKSVLLSGAALRASIAATAARVGQGAWLRALPASYVAGLQVVLRALEAGHDAVAVRGRFTPASFVEAARELPSDAAHFTSMVPAQLVTMLDAAERNADARAVLASFEAILVGGQALPAPVQERAEALGARIVRTYGATETCGGCVYDGYPLPGVSARAVDGELQLAGPMLADGYLGEPERTDRSFFVEDGVRWYRTGDLGSIDDGHVTITGRIDNVIVSGGINVSLDRVEKVVRSLRGLERAVVVGVPDERWGEASVVVADRRYVVAAEADLRDRIRAVVGEELGTPARPARLVLIDGMPLLTSGKPDRTAVRALLG